MAGSHGRELWFDTDLGDEYILHNHHKALLKYTGYTTVYVHNEITALSIHVN